MKNIIILDGFLPPLMCIQLIFDVQANTIMRIAIMYIILSTSAPTPSVVWKKPVYSRILASLDFF